MSGITIAKAVISSMVSSSCKFWIFGVVLVWLLKVVRQ